MKDYDNSVFYHSKAWKRVSTAYMTSRSYICERCGNPATICHHKKHLDGKNVNDPKVALNFDNLEALCQDCHNKEHFSNHDFCKFDEAGNVVGKNESQTFKQFNEERNKINDLLLRICSQESSEAL